MHSERTMKAITLRNLSPELAKELEREAAASQTSLNKLVIGLLEKATGLSRRQGPRPRFHDLDEIGGAWSAEEAREFDEVLESQRRIDPELWH